ncbi:reticulon-4-like isoform X3 [Clupea harengus]|uniref:Reticulon n=1 Tax=Clupea harengus TaxID=7950 RepID=A0A6P3VIK8_CLUHA|nr:reticulon-4-like isoform X3 [Clupea harengus]
MADTEQVSSTTPNEELKVQTSEIMGDVKEPGNEAEAKVVANEVSDIGGEAHGDTEKPKDTPPRPQEPPIETTEFSSPPSAPEEPPQTAPKAPAPESVTSTSEDATEQLTKEAVTVEAAPTAPAHTEDIAAEKPLEDIVEPVPKVEEKPTPEVVVPEAVAEPIIVSEPSKVETPAPVPVPEEAVLVDEPVVVSAPSEVSAPEPVVVEEPVIEPKVEAPVEEPIVVQEPPKVAAPVEEPIVVEPPKVAAPVEEALPAPTVAPSLVDLLYWRDVKTTGAVFGANLLLLFSLTMCSIISVLSYVALALLSVTITFRIYKGILQAIQKSDEGHPFKLYLDKDVALSDEAVQKYSDLALGRMNSGLIELRRLFLVEDLVDSLKFAVFMWILTYIGALFNGLTLLILGLVSAFGCPLVYEKHQTQIDHYLALVNNQIKDIVAKVQAKVPGLKKKAE